LGRESNLTGCHGLRIGWAAARLLPACDYNHFACYVHNAQGPVIEFDTCISVPHSRGGGIDNSRDGIIIRS